MWNSDKPILKIEITEAANLQLLDSNIRPFLSFSSGTESVKSSIGTQVDEKFTWKEKLSISLDPKLPLIISLFTDCEDEEVFLDKVTYQFSELASMKKNFNTWIAFASSKKKVETKFSISGILSAGIKRESGTSPQVNISMNFLHNNYLRIVEVKIESYKIILKSKDAYTIYNAHVRRNDDSK